MQHALDFTMAAATKVLTLMQEEDNLALKLRVYITGGGCSGFQYQFAFAETVNDDDVVVEREVLSAGQTYSVTLLVDSISYQYMAGAKIDFREGIGGDEFVISNPQAVTTCGCGSSFSTD